MSKLIFSSLCLLVSSFVSSAAEAETIMSAQMLLEKMTLTYSQVEYMKADFAKKSKSMLLGTEEKTKGALEYSKKKFRLEMETDPKSIFIKGDKSFWHISDNDVTTGASGKAVPSVFEAIFSDVTIWSKLGTSYVSVPNKTAEIKVDPKGQIPNIKEMVLKIDSRKRTLLSLTYTDDVNNSVDISLKKTRFFKKAKPDRFVYKVKKTDNVSRM